MHQIATNLTICSRESNAIAISMYSSFMVLSLVGNSLLIAVFYRHKSLRTPVHCFIMNMTLSDLIIPIVSLPTAIIRLTYHDSTILCKIVSLVGCVSSVVSMSSMVAIAFDRFYAIVFPMKPPLFSQSSCQRVIIITWIVSVAIQGYYFEMYCDKALESISFFCFFSFTAFILTLLYSIIIFFLYRQKTDLHLASETVKLRAKENRKITVMLAIIVVAFYLLWIPFHIYNFQKHDVVNNCSWTRNLPVFHTVINSLVYMFFNKTFRDGCRELLCRPLPCTKWNACSLLSITPQEHNNTTPNSSLHNQAVENHELQIQQG